MEQEKKLNKLELVLREYGVKCSVEVIQPHDDRVLSLKIKTAKELEFNEVLTKLSELAKALVFEVSGLGSYHLMGNDKGAYYVFYMDFDAE